MMMWLRSIWAWILCRLGRYPAEPPKVEQFDKDALELIRLCREYKRNDWVFRNSWRLLNTEEYQAMFAQHNRPSEQTPSGVYRSSTFKVCMDQFKHDLAKKHQYTYLTLQVKK